MNVNILFSDSLKKIYSWILKDLNLISLKADLMSG